LARKTNASAKLHDLNPQLIPKSTQGPDARTIVDAATRNIILLNFFTPETTREAMLQGIRDAVELLLRVARGEAGEITVIPPLV
jgi:hypothetical protein